MAKILIVDDSTIVRRNLKAILTRAGHEIVAEAENGLQAYREYESHKPDLITMDITMPIMDGLEAALAIKEKNPRQKIIMLSAMSDQDIVADAMSRGINHFCSKPFKAEDMIAKILQVINE